MNARIEWSAAGITVRPAMAHTREYGLKLTTARGYRETAHLPPELARSLRDWLTWYLADKGDPPPADPDLIRTVIDYQRAQLTERSMAVENHDFRAGLAWADNALTAIYRAAGGTT